MENLSMSEDMENVSRDKDMTRLVRTGTWKMLV